MSFKSKCEEANHICDKGQYKEASFWEQVKLNFHLLYCRVCRKYSATNNKLTKVVKNPKVQTISSSEKEALKQRVQEQLNATSNN